MGSWSQSSFLTGSGEGCGRTRFPQAVSPKGIFVATVFFHNGFCKAHVPNMWTRCRVVRLRAASSEPDHPTKHTRAEVWTNKGIHVTTMKNSDGQPWCFVSSFFDEMCVEVSARHQATCQTARDAGCPGCNSSLPQQLLKRSEEGGPKHTHSQCTLSQNGT